MTKDELNEYAAANRSRLEKQKVALGDLVMILVGRFAGKNGVIKGISVCGNEFTDPYYEVDMACEVPDKYKCRKTLIQPNNVIGGLGASDFVVIANRATDDEPKPKFQVGDKVEIDNLLSAYDGIVGTIARILIGETVNYCVKIQNDIITVNEDSLSPYTEPTAEEEEEKEQGCYLDFSKGIKAVLDGDFKPIDTTPIKTNPIRIINDDWQSYRMELAAKIAVAYSEKGRYEPSEIGAKAVEVANGVVERLKNGEV